MADNDKICKVYDKEDFFTLLIQIVLAIVALASLYIKRLQEVPRRTFETWFLDVSKQAIGAGYAHVLNMIVAAIISQNSRGETILQDQCAWYGISYIIDTSLGLILAIIFLGWLDQLANTYHWEWLKDSGVYSGPHAPYIWSTQVIAWILILTITKIILYLVLWLCSAPLAAIGGLLFAPLQSNIRFELVFVMILFPGIMNVIYFWVADSFLKAKKDKAEAHEPLPDKEQPLVGNTTTTTTTQAELV